MASNKEESNSYEDEFTFDQQLSYCQIFLERKLEKERISPKAAQSLLQSLKILQSDKSSFIKKRQVMRVSCGDYRKDMHDMVQTTKKCVDELVMNQNELEKMTHGLCRQLGRKKVANTTGSENELQVAPFRFNFPMPDNENHLSS